MATVTRSVPETFEEAAAALAAASSEVRTVRIRGAGTKLGWGRPIPPAEVELGTAALDEVVEHNTGDHTAVLQAGVPLARAQEAFAAAGQRLSLDPPLGEEQAATIGGIVATGDSGPLRHRFGAPRDLVLGMTVALSDGTLAHSGGKVIKNVAGYDLAKLFAGSFGTLGLILDVSVRLHPLLPAATTVHGQDADPDRLAGAALALARAPLEFEALDVAWRGGQGALLARCSGSQHARRGQRTARLLEELGLDAVEVTEDDEALWERQRAGQRSGSAAVVGVAHRPSTLAGVLRVVERAGGAMVGRAALGLSYLTVAPEAVAELRRALAPAGTTLLDAPAALRSESDPWGEPAEASLRLMRAVKARFDPRATCNPGLFVGGI